MYEERYHKRVHDMQMRLRQSNFDGILICQNVDLFYFTGTMQAGFLFIPCEGEAIFWVRRSFERAKAESAIPIRAFPGLKEMAATIEQKTLANQLPTLQIALEYDVLPVQWYLRFSQAFIRTSWHDGSKIIREQRMIKTEEEVFCIRQAAKVVDRVFMQTLSEIHEGMSELDLLQTIESGLRANGHFGPMRMRAFNQEIYNGLVGAGASVAMPTYFDGPAGGLGLGPAFPQSASRHPIRKGDPVLVDIGCQIDGYIIDQTRTIVIGKLSHDMEDAYHHANQILKKIELQLRPGVRCAEIYETALSYALAVGLEEHFMGYGADRVKFIGHGIGLEVDEWPVLAKGSDFYLQAGMVIAIEPKFSFPGIGVIGIEDSYLIEKNGFERLTCTDQRLFSV
jgi:Xaa-Pro dipeptidase